jgi:hypothetical protein
MLEYGMHTGTYKAQDSKLGKGLDRLSPALALQTISPYSTFPDLWLMLRDVEEKASKGDQNVPSPNTLPCYKD